MKMHYPSSDEIINNSCKSSLCGKVIHIVFITKNEKEVECKYCKMRIKKIKKAGNWKY